MTVRKPRITTELVNRKARQDRYGKVLAVAGNRAVIGMVGGGRQEARVIGNVREGDTLPVHRVNGQYEVQGTVTAETVTQVVEVHTESSGGGGSTNVAAGDGVNVSGNPTSGYTISARLGDGLAFDENGAIEATGGGGQTTVSEGNGIDVAGNPQDGYTVSTRIGQGLEYDANGALIATGGGGAITWDNMPARVKRGVRLAIYLSSFI